MGGHLKFNIFIFLGACVLTVTTAATLPSICESLKSPVNGMVQCSRNLTILTCTAACNTGHVFITGTTTIRRVCDDVTGQFDNQAQLPDCVASICRTPLLPTVKDAKISASSVWTGVRGYNFGPERSRLDSKVTADGSGVQSGGWRAESNTLDQYVQVELNSVMRISGIVTQGRAVLGGDTANEYVTRFRVLYSMDGLDWKPYGSHTVSDQFLDGNSDSTTPKSNILSCPFDAKYVRLNPLSWHENIALRFELYGCQPNGQPTCISELPKTTMAAQTTPKVQPTPNVHNVPTKPADHCTALPPPTNGAINCEKRDTQLVCVANCNDGYIFETGDLLVKSVCQRNTGAWTAGSHVPACVYNTHATPIPPKHNYTNGCLTAQKECDNAGNGDFQACGGCHFFASCSEGFLYVRACPEALLFDATSGVCDYHSGSCPH